MPQSDKAVPAAGNIAAHFAPGPVLLMGEPGAGKGTQAHALMGIWQVPQISTGDILRALRNDPVQAQTPLGQLTASLLSTGKLLPDEHVNALVAHRLALTDTNRGFILDGFPRTLGQAEWLDHHLTEVPEPDGQMRLPVVAVNIHVSYNQLLRRITGRRNCPVCKNIYNVYSHPPKFEGKCDLDGALLEQRVDDTEAVMEERMRAYRAQTTPVIEHYRACGRFLELDGELPESDLTARILAEIDRFRAAGAERESL